MSFAHDFRSVLDVYPEDPGFTCVGTTRRGLRCGNSFLRNAYLREASGILNELSSIVGTNRQSAELLPRLRRLAYLTLCPRWHQARLPQVEPVTARWLAQIQNLGVVRSAYTPLTPPATPRAVPRQLDYRPTLYLPPPPSMFSQQISTPSTNTLQVYTPPVQNYTPPVTPPRTPPRVTSLFSNPTMPARNTTTQPATDSTYNQTRYNSSRTGRNVNISFNVNVDSNQITREHTRGTHTYSSPPDSPTADNSSSQSSRLSHRSNSRSTSSSSSSSSSGRQTLNTLSSQLAALQTQMAVLSAQYQAAQAQVNSPRSSRSSHSSANAGSPAPSLISHLDLQSPRNPPPSHSTHSSRSRSSVARSSTPEPDDPNDSDFEPSSSSSSNSSPRGAGARVHTPSSSSLSSPVVLSPIRSAAPSPSSANSVASATVRRRPITPDTSCYVCYENIVSERDAAWCRASCGQNICLGCWTEWVSEQLDEGVGGRGIVCGFCRAPWRF